MAELLPFAGRVALVTGGSRGIGRATALRLADEGADVAISYVSRREAADEVVAAVRARGRRALAVPCNVACKDEVDRLVAETAAALGPVELLAHCGAISNLAGHEELDLARWQEMLDVNLTGTYLVAFAVKDAMIARGYGRIVTLSSVAALAPRAMQIHYSVSKAGVIAFTRCLAEALAPHNVRVNCVAPGIVETEMVHMLPDEQLERVIGLTPMRRIGEPEEIAGVIRFLLSEDAAYMTGQTLCPSGGRVMVP